MSRDLGLETNVGISLEFWHFGFATMANHLEPLAFLEELLLL